MMEEESSNTSDLKKRPRGILRRKNAFEIVGTILLALATIMSAWCAFQAARWNGRYSDKKAEESRSFVLYSKYDNLAATEKTYDFNMFMDYQDAVRMGDLEKVEEYEDYHFRDELWVAVEAWKERVAKGEDIPTILLLPEYVNNSELMSQYWSRRARISSQLASEAATTSYGYLAFTVVFASIMLFAALSMKLTIHQVRVVALSLASIGFGIALILVVLRPIT